jgi:hypothetical protein
MSAGPVGSTSTSASSPTSHEESAAGGAGQASVTPPDSPEESELDPSPVEDVVESEPPPVVPLDASLELVDGVGSADVASDSDMPDVLGGSFVVGAVEPDVEDAAAPLEPSVSIALPPESQLSNTRLAMRTDRFTRGRVTRHVAGRSPYTISSIVK